MASTIDILNASDIARINTHRQFTMYLKIGDPTAGADFQVDFTYAVTTPGMAGTSTIVATSAGTIFGSSITDLYIPTSSKELYFSVVIDQEADLNGECVDVTHTATIDGVDDDVTMAYVTDKDPTGGYDKDKLLVTVASVYINGKLMGFCDTDGVAINSIVDYSKISSGSVLGCLYDANTKNEIEHSFTLQQWELDTFKMMMGLQSSKATATDINMFGGTYTGEKLVLAPNSPGLATEYAVRYVGNAGKDGYQLIWDFPFCSLKGGVDFLMKIPDGGKSKITFNTHLTFGPTYPNGDYGTVYRVLAA